MEILMKLKCSPTTPSSNAAHQHSTLKVVDHHHQLTQQHSLCPGPVQSGAPPPSHTLTRLSSHSSVGLTLHHHHHPHSVASPIPPPPLAPALSISPACLDYSGAPMRCCSVGAIPENDLLDWERRQLPPSYANYYDPPPTCCSGIAPPQAASLSPFKPASAAPPPLIAATPLSINNSDFHVSYEYHEPEENFVSIDDAKIKSFLMKIGQAQADKEKAEERAKKAEEKLQAATRVIVKPVVEAPVVYEIIDLDDENDRKELQQIKKRIESEAQKKAAQAQLTTKTVTQTAAAQNPPKQLKPPSISLIPKSPAKTQITEKRKSTRNTTNERIIAQIELTDSSDDDEAPPSSEEKHTGELNTHEAADSLQSAPGADDIDDVDDDDDDSDLPLAAAAVSCELHCDDDDDDDEAAYGQDNDTMNGSNEIVILHSDDEEENVEYAEKVETANGRELRWGDELEEAKERNFFECLLCGKKVQSSYNLRRHMMIHTGERPFGCDLCDRRFREFSDLKKHRRRHAHEANFVCMVCRINAPMAHDPTRCSACDTKSGALTAAMYSQEAAQSPASTEKTQTITTTTRATKTPSPPPLSPQKGSNKTVLSTTINPSSPHKTQSPSATSSPHEVPSLIPLTSGSTATASSTQVLLDNIPAVHRPSFNQLGVITRKEFPCPLCQRPFGTRHNLKRHFMIHTGEKPFSCSKCRKPFREYSTLKKHMVTHQRDRFYKCLRCPNKYRDYLDYNEHLKTHGNEEDDNSGGQVNCGPSARKRTKMRLGYDEYDTNDEDDSSEDWLECCECQQRYTDIETYTEHLKEHDPGLFLYECYICKKAFEQRDELVEHVSACKEELRETALRRVNVEEGNKS